MLKTGMTTNLKLETRIDPTLILRSELVELPILLLEARVQLELSANPFLETDLEQDDEADRQEDQNSDDNDTSAEKDELDWEEVVKDFADYEDTYSEGIDKNEEEMEFQPPVMSTLKDSLEEQLHVNDFDDEEIEIAREIIGNLDPDGYLACPLFDITKQFPGLSDADTEKVLKKVQLLEPIGIAARDIRECLIVQLTASELYIEDAYIVLRDYYEDFVNKRYEYIMKKTSIDREQMQEIIDEITSLNPKPGASLILNPWEKNAASAQAEQIVPDFYVREIDGELKIYANEGTIPSFRINTAYGNMIMSTTTERDTKDFVKRKLEAARWFINAIYQRKMTLMKVMTALTKFQEDFFRDGPSRLRPLILKEVAEEIEMDVATVSRCTKDKYVDTEYGVYELKYFFTERLATQDGEEVSTTLIKERIRVMISAENKKSPLSDQDIADMLEKEGHTAARRTVAKYREQLSLPVARLRKEL